MVELALGRKELFFPPFEAEPAVMQIKVAAHEELHLTMLREVQALGPRRAAEDRDGRLDGVNALVDDGRVEVSTAAWHCPGGI